MGIHMPDSDASHILLYTEIPHQLLPKGKPRVRLPVSKSVLSLKSLGKKCSEQQKLFTTEVK